MFTFATVGKLCGTVDGFFKIFYLVSNKTLFYPVLAERRKTLRISHQVSLVDKQCHCRKFEVMSNNIEVMCNN